ncbi:MAG: ATP-binding protein [Fibrobacterota bacterium]|nr:MAG: ATP-binding protein [Fibrobacterota bacterium]
MIHRHLAATLERRLKASRSVYVFGARQTGKTTLARGHSELPYVTMEDPETRQEALADPRGFLARFPKGAILDEAQRAPEIFSYLQRILDERKGKWILTGSQNYLLLESVTQSLAGRISLLQLSPLSHSEIQGRTPSTPASLRSPGKGVEVNRSQLWETMLLGGYPEPVTEPDTREFWHGDYVRTFVERDVRQILNVHDTLSFQRFLQLTAGRTGQILNLTQLASDAGISVSSCKQWLSVLETSGIIHLLRPHFQNFNKRITKSPKLYFNDTGLVCRLLGIRNPEVLSLHPLVGSIFETWVIAELRKIWLNQGEEPPMWYWRDPAGLEVDVLVDDGMTLHPIEIKMGATVDSEWLTRLNRWKELAGDVAGQPVLIHGGDAEQVRSKVVLRSWIGI